MSASQKARASVGICPFCGVATAVNHETQEGCIAALHAEIGRMRGILATVKPAGLRDVVTEEDAPPTSVRLSLAEHKRP